MESDKQEMAGNNRCPCGSGKKYGHCCKKKDFKWVKDSAGKIYRQIPIQPILAEVIEQERKRFIKIYGREPGAGDPFLAEMPSAKEIEEGMIEVMIKSGAPPEFIYAYQKTGLLVTEFNVNLLPDKDLKEWNSACREFRRLSKRQSATPPQADEWFTKVELLFQEVDACKIFFRRIIRTHGIAINIKTGHKRNEPLHDFVFMLLTKSLKSVEAADRLLEGNYGEDTLILIRSIYEAYLTINFLITHPEKINSFVAAEVGRKVGACEFVRDGNGKRMIVNRKDGTQFEIFSTAKMAKLSSYKEDILIYNFFYGYLSEFSHPSIWALESYVDGCRFDPGGSSKVTQAGIYTLFCASLVLDTMVTFKDFDAKFRGDLCVFLRRLRGKLMEVFERMKDGKDNSVPKLFRQRASHLSSQCPKGT